MTTYHAIGDVRGSCRHKHRTIAAAVACQDRDANACARLGGGAYSDRYVRRTDGRALTESERDEIYYHEHGESPWNPYDDR